MDTYKDFFEQDVALAKYKELIHGSDPRHMQEDYLL